MCWKTRLLARRGPVMTPKTGRKMPLKRNTPKANKAVGAPACLAAGTPNCSLCNPPFTSWTLTPAVPPLLKTAAPYLPGEHRPGNRKSAGGYWNRIYWKLLSPCQRIYFTTQAFPPIFGYCPAINARSGKARYS